MNIFILRILYSILRDCGQHKLCGLFRSVKSDLLYFIRRQILYRNLLRDLRNLLLIYFLIHKVAWCPLNHWIWRRKVIILHILIFLGNLLLIWASLEKRWHKTIKKLLWGILNVSSLNSCRRLIYLSRPINHLMNPSVLFFLFQLWFIPLLRFLFSLLFTTEKLIKSLLFYDTASVFTAAPEIIIILAEHSHLHINLFLSSPEYCLMNRERGFRVSIFFVYRKFASLTEGFRTAIYSTDKGFGTRVGILVFF